jgi:hypothetical protein
MISLKLCAVLEVQDVEDLTEILTAAGVAFKELSGDSEDHFNSLAERVEKILAGMSV